MTATFASTWQLRTRRIEFGRLPVVMGILNVTPDSFSDGGRHSSTDAAVTAALKMEDAGAGIIDIGGESTRPYSTPVDADQELRRVLPVVEALQARLEIPISIDTSKSRVAEAAIDAGAEILNDVTGLEGDAEMPGLAARTGVGVCVMHMRGTPQTMQDDPRYDDVVGEIDGYLRQRLQFCLDRAIGREKICLDPGIGFGKTHQHNLDLLAHVDQFLEIGPPILVGHSRKGFIAHLLRDKQCDRTAGTLGVTIALAQAGVQVVRVHDVAATMQALLLWQAAGGDRR